MQKDPSSRRKKAACGDSTSYDILKRLIIDWSWPRKCVDGLSFVMERLDLGCEGHISRAQNDWTLSKIEYLLTT
jgi:hypothetical protein